MKNIYTAEFKDGKPKLYTIQVIDEHHLSPGATEETYLCREVGSSHKFVTGKDRYKDSPEEAYVEQRNEFLQGIVDAENEIEKLRDRISRHSDMLKMIP